MNGHKYWKRVCALILTLLFLVIAAGCASKAETAPANGYSEQTLWQLLDETGEAAAYLKETDPDVLEISQLIGTHIACVDNRSAADVNFTEESETYTADFLKSLLSSGYNVKLEELYQRNVLAISAVSTIWNPSTINAARTSCKVDIDSVFCFTAGDGEYLNLLGVELNTNYTEHRIYYCEKLDGIWKIANIEKSALYQ